MNRVLGIAIALLVGGLVPPAHIHAQDVSEVLGRWENVMETPRGSMTQHFVFQAADGALTGTVESPRGSVELQNVKFEDGMLSFEVVREFRGNSMTRRFTAQVSGAQLEGTVSGGRGGEREFTATRVMP